MARQRGWSTKPQGDYVDLRTSEIFRYLRNRDWTMADLAREMGRHEVPPNPDGFNRSTVHRLLTGTMDCDERKADLIAKAFDVTVEAIADPRQVAA